MTEPSEGPHRSESDDPLDSASEAGPPLDLEALRLDEAEQEAVVRSVMARIAAEEGATTPAADGSQESEAARATPSAVPGGRRAGWFDGWLLDLSLWARPAVFAALTLLFGVAFVIGTSGGASETDPGTPRAASTPGAEGAAGATLATRPAPDPLEEWIRGGVDPTPEQVLIEFAGRGGGR